MGTTAQDGAAGNDGTSTPPSPGRTPLTPTELHEKRKAWGREYGNVMSDIKRQHDAKGK